MRWPMVVWTLKKQTVSRNYSKNKQIGFFNHKYLQSTTLYVDKRTITEKTYPNNTFEDRNIFGLWC